MAKRKNNTGSVTRRASEMIDSVVQIVSPKTAYRRMQYRMAYDAVDASRNRKKRIGLGGSGDRHLTPLTLGKLREIARDMSRNNPLAKGLLLIERDGVVGSGPIVQSDTGDEVLDKEMDAAWNETMIESPCDVTGQFNFNKFIRKAYLSYRRDGDFLILFTRDGLQAIEGEQIGTPVGGIDREHYEVKNGVAFSKKTGRVVGYFIGKPDKWGYIRGDSYRMFEAQHACHMFDPERFSQSRGEPVLTSAVEWIDKTCDYMDAELVAAKVQACFTMFVSTEDFEGVPAGYTEGISETGEDEEGNRLEKMNPGTILYGGPDDKATGIGMNRPGAMFEPFINQMLMMIGRPLCMPLMLVTGDFSGATFMNARIAYQKVQDIWLAEQSDILRPSASMIRRGWVQQRIDAGDFNDRDGIFGHKVRCRKWPYVDPYKEAMADKVELGNGTINQTLICERKGLDFTDVAEQGGKDHKLIIENNTGGDPTKKYLPGKPGNGKGENDVK